MSLEKNKVGLVSPLPSSSSGEKNSVSTTSLREHDGLSHDRSGRKKLRPTTDESILVLLESEQLMATTLMKY